VTYEVTIKERNLDPEPHALADALMYADGKPIVDIRDMSIRLSGVTRESIVALWCGRHVPVRFGPERILAFAIGKPSEAFGDLYQVFDEERFIARLPGPPYQFLGRITHIEARPWQMVAGGVIESEYDVPPDAWYFAAERQPVMPLSVLLEVALQSCGWLAAYLGSALTSSEDLCFRNLGGTASLLAVVGPETGTLTTRVRITRVAQSAGMILQDYDFETRAGNQPVYRGSTSFGFFTRPALAQQVGIRDGQLYQPTAEELGRALSFDYPPQPPFPDDTLRMIDRIEWFVADGGPAGQGVIQGTKRIRPEEWFFKAHFYQDPVWPGSLGLEALLQLLKVVAVQRWPEAQGFEPWDGFAIRPTTERFELRDGLQIRPTAKRFEPNQSGTHTWVYRGQVIPSNREVTVQALVTSCSEEERQLTAEGSLAVDGLVIYRMKDFRLSVR
jgi:3-hydroxymyristoyl/3-hydroxydecanoyl-(acyl carrier protein) dehydratase